MSRKYWLMGAAALQALTITGAPALAQDETSADEERIVVTTERREQDIQDVPSLAQVFTAEDLKRDGVGSELRNLGTSVPGLNISNQEGNLEIFIRGVGSANNTELGDPAAAPHINGVYIPRPRGLGTQFYDIERVEVSKGPQGTLRGRNAVAGTLNIITRKPELNELSGYAEVTFGTQNQRVAEGAINVPLNDVSAIRIAGFGETHDSYFTNAGPDARLDAAGAEDEIAGRFSFLYEPHDRFSFTVVADYLKEGGTGYPGADLFGAFQDGQTFDSLDPREVVYRGVQGELDSEHWGVMTNVAYDLGPFTLEYLGSYRNLDFAQRNASADGVAHPGRDVSASAINLDNFSTVYWQTRSRSFVHELRAYSPDDARLRWTTGLFYMDEEQEVGFFSLNDNGVFFSGVEFTFPDVQVESFAAFADATYDVTDQFRFTAGIRYTEDEKSRDGIGGNWTLGLGSENFNCCFATRLGTPGFLPALINRENFNAPDPGAPNSEIAAFLLQGALQFGGQDTIEQQLAGIIDGTAPNGTCIDRDDINGGGSQVCPANGQHSFLTLGAPADQQGEFSDDFIDWRLGIEYDLTPDNLFYARVSTGTKSGGFNDNLTPETAPEFGTENLIAYEVGTKNIFDWMGRRLTFNASAFYYDYQDQVFQSLVQIGAGGGEESFSLLNENVADSTIFGIEAFGQAELPFGFSVDATVLYLDAEVDTGELADVRGQDFGVNPTVANIDLSGNRLPLTSEYQVIMRLQQVQDLFGGQFDWQVLANYRSDYFLSVFNDDEIQRPAGSTICGSNDAVACGFENLQEAFWTVNLGAGYTSESGMWRVEGFVTNLLDTDASNKALIGNALNLRFLNLPRTGGARLSVRF